MQSVSFPSPRSENAGHTLISRLQNSAIFRDYREAFETTTGLPLALRTTGSFRPPLENSKKLNPFCALMAASNRSCAACLQMQQRLEEDAENGPRTVECFAGLSESAVPVRVGSNVPGYLQTGQVLLRKPTAARFVKITRQLAEWNIQIDAEQLKAAYFRTRVLTKLQYDSVLRLLDIFAQHLAVQSNQIVVSEASVESPVVTKARQYIATHLGSELSLPEVARAVNMSAYYFCKLFKRALGFTFTSYVSRSRVEHTKQLLLNPHTRVSEAAFEAGFQSLSQFNRAFRRITGESPTTYRDRLHRQTGNRSGANSAFAHAA